MFARTPEVEYNQSSPKHTVQRQPSTETIVKKDGIPTVLRATNWSRRRPPRGATQAEVPEERTLVRPEIPGKNWDWPTTDIVTGLGKRCVSRETYTAVQYVDTRFITDNASSVELGETELIRSYKKQGAEMSAHVINFQAATPHTAACVRRRRAMMAASPIFQLLHLK